MASVVFFGLVERDGDLPLGGEPVEQLRLALLDGVAGGDVEGGRVDELAGVLARDRSQHGAQRLLVAAALVGLARDLAIALRAEVLRDVRDALGLLVRHLRVRLSDELEERDQRDQFVVAEVLEVHGRPPIRGPHPRSRRAPRGPHARSSRPRSIAASSAGVPCTFGPRYQWRADATHQTPAKPTTARTASGV